MKIKFFYLLLLFLISCQQKKELPITIELDSNWQFKKITDSKWFNATVPGNVYSDLLENKLIKDPFAGNNELDVQWVSDADWEYKTNFNLDKKTLLKKNLELNFKGLDTYATVYLNNQVILKANNAFRAWRINVKAHLKKENELRIVFDRTSKHEKVEKEKLNYQMPEGNRIFTRKAQFQYGWDWGPKLNTLGVWKPITLHSWNDFKIEDVYIKQHKLNESITDLSAELELFSTIETQTEIQIYINDNLKKTYKVEANINKFTIPFSIKNPKLWWPHNLGTPYLYNIKIVAKQNGIVLDTFKLKKGLRTIDLITEKDSIGESFYFKVNGKPIYAKGANYIPQNSMQNKVTNEHYKRLLTAVVDANMNMLRVWGGGIYENDIFYDLCDEKGILVWQDFMFACAMYPGDDQFLENVNQEAIQQVKRLRNHASIALWCGNNESSEGWRRWGWQEGKSTTEKEKIWNDYLKVFNGILPENVKTLTNTPYWESSPKYGRGNPKYKTEGDAHDWWIWHDGYPFEHLEKNVPRFMSEFGFQSFPSYEAIRFINESDSILISSKAFLTHQKHSRGFQLIKEYMERDFPVPTKADDYVYVSQLLQAYGISKGIHAHRRAKPYNMGTLYWQLNDCWPVASWSSIDYFGNWKALHYNAKKAFENVLISSVVENDVLKTYVVNDALSSKKGDLKIQIMDFNGIVIWEDTIQIESKANSSALNHKMDLKTLKIDKDKVVVVAKFNSEESIFYLTNPKELKLKIAKINKKIVKTTTGFEIILESKTLQKNVFLYLDQKAHFSNNYFDILPNKPIIISVKTEASNIQSLKIKTLNVLGKETH